MARILWQRVSALGFLLAASLGAQQPEPSTLGLEIRASFPESGLADAAGGGSVPGAGFRLVMEDDLADYFEGWRVRGAVGMDFWFWGNLTKLPGTSGRVTAGHLTGELVRMLRPGGDPVTLGPYMVMGLGIYEWSYDRNDPVLGSQEVKVGHAAGTFGFGWRTSKALDLEAKVLMGKLDPTTTAVAVMASAAWRF